MLTASLTLSRPLQQGFPPAPLLLDKAGIQILADLLFIHVLADEDNLLHAVAIVRIPVFHDSRVLTHHADKFLFRRCGIPLSGLTQHNLLSGLLEKT